MNLIRIYSHSSTGELQKAVIMNNDCYLVKIRMGEINIKVIPFYKRDDAEKAIDILKPLFKDKYGDIIQLTVDYAVLPKDTLNGIAKIINSTDSIINKFILNREKLVENINNIRALLYE